MTPLLTTEIITKLADTGWVIIRSGFAQAAGLATYAVELDIDQMQPAGIGKAEQFRRAANIRSDKILWLQQESHPAIKAYLATMDALRAALNEQLFLGLFDYECHFSHYAPGTFYQKHKDAFSGVHNKAGNRKLSSVFYLNENWQPGDGGELVLYEPDSDNEIIRIIPELGTLVLFLSEEFPHEVLPVNKARWSLTGWFRTRGD